MPVETSQKEVLIHQKFPEYGKRKITVSDEIYLEGEDVKLLKEDR